MPRRFLTLSLLLLMCLVNRVSAAQSPSKPTLVYGIPHYPPYSLIHKDSYSGRDVELIRLLAQKLDVDIAFSACEWIRCLELAKSGKLDLLSAVSHAQEREAYLHFIQPAYSAGSIVFWVRKGEAHRLSQYQDLLTLNVGKEKAARLFKPVDDNPSITTYESPDYQVLLKMLASRRIDTVMGGSLVLDAAIAKSQFAEQLEKALYQHQVPSSYLVFARHSPNASQWVPKLEQQMQALMVRGELEYFTNWQANRAKDSQTAH